MLIHFRKNHPLFARTTYLKNHEVDWHGHQPFEPDWEPSNRFVAYTLKDPDHQHEIYIAFNAGFEAADIELPPPPQGKSWRRVVDTTLPSPQDFDENFNTSQPLPLKYHMHPHSMNIDKSHMMDSKELCLRW